MDSGESMLRMGGEYIKINLEDIVMQAHGRKTRRMGMEDKLRQQISMRVTLLVIKSKGSGY